MEIFDEIAYNYYKQSNENRLFVVIRLRKAPEGGDFMSLISGNVEGRIKITDIMKRDIPVIHAYDSIKKAIKMFYDHKLDTLPVVNDDGSMTGILTTRRIYRALYEGLKLDDLFTDYIIHEAVYNTTDLTYDEQTLVTRVNKSKVPNVLVLEPCGKVAGIAGNREYLSTAMDVISKSNTLMESILQAIQEGIVTVDTRGNIVHANVAAENMFGIRYKEIKGKHISGIFY